MDIINTLLKKAEEWDRLARQALDPAVRRICQNHRGELMEELRVLRADHLDRILSGLDYK